MDSKIDGIIKPKHKIKDIILIKGADEQFEIKRAFFDESWFYFVEDNYDDAITDKDILANLTNNKWYCKINKEKVNLFDDNSDEIRISKLLFSKMLEINPTYKQPDFQKWASDVDKMIRLDNRPSPMIEKVIELVFNDSFWRGNIQSTSKLRLQFDKLVTKFSAQMQEQQIKINKNKPIIC